MKSFDQSCFEWIEKKTATQNFARVYVCSPEISFGKDEKGMERWLSTSKIINEMIWEVLLSQKELVINTRSSRVFDENGRTILENKATSWRNFLQANKVYNQTFQSLKLEKSKLVKQEVAALANLMLKLSISMGKNSLTVFNSMLLPDIINPSILAVAFLQFLNSEILEKHNQNLTGQIIHHSKQKKSVQEALVDFYRQLPVITLINITKKRCRTDLELLNKNYSNLIPLQEHRVQFIELFQEENESQDQFYSSRFSLAINIKKHLGLSAPYGYELLMFFQEVLLSFMRNVSPNAILLVENYPSSVVAIKPEVYGLLINELMTKVTDKIHISRQFGIQDSRYCKCDTRCEREPTNQEMQSAVDIQSIEIEEQQQAMEGQFQAMEEQPSLDQYEFRLLAEFQKGKKKKEKKYLADSTRCILQALSQRVNFDLELEEEAQYDYPLQFLKGLRTMIVALELKATEGNYLKVHTEAEHRYRIKHLQQMIFLKESNCIPKKWIDEVYCIPLKKRIRLLENMQFKWSEKDFTYIFYVEDQSMFVFIAQTHKYWLLRWESGKGQVVLVRKYEFAEGELPKLEGFTAVASDKYLYIGFGKERNNNSAIYRLRLDNPRVWVSTTTAKLDQVSLKLENKVQGYGYYSREHKMVLFMGGFNYLADNEERVNIYHYCVFQDDQIFVVRRGEKSSDHFFAKNKTHFQHCVIHTFVKGIVFPMQSSRIAILNTNGLREDLNYKNRLYLTDMNISSIFKNCGIIFQHKNDVHSEQSKLNRNEILRLIDGSSNYVNIYGREAVLMDREGLAWKMQFSEDQLNIDLEQMNIPRAKKLNENAMQDQKEESVKSLQVDTKMEEEKSGKNINVRFLQRPNNSSSMFTNDQFNSYPPGEGQPKSISEKNEGSSNPNSKGGVVSYFSKGSEPKSKTSTAQDAARMQQKIKSEVQPQLRIQIGKKSIASKAKPN